MRRGESGLSLVVGVDKPTGMTSHDVVSRVRRVFGEKRVGHAGTLDPLASGVLAVCVGPATRLDALLTGHDKSYEVRVAFGAATDTDDAEGQVIRTAPVPDELADPFAAASFVASLVGRHRQLPPVYSAIKVGGRKACDEARKGRIIELEPRDIEIYDARLIGVNGVDGSEPLSWDVALRVSKGTYVRSIARDMGNALDCPAHVAALRRTEAGALTLEDCVSLEVLEEVGLRAALDPVRLLGLRFAYAEGPLARAVANGNVLEAGSLCLCERRTCGAGAEFCACTAGVRESCQPPRDGELVSIVADNRLAAVYEYESARERFRPRCVFSTGVIRGSDI
ncbi:MAG: tRNA pseudouridine(55) synthase TruB [Eggerthellaceae bacterium]|nr:tRNA pseudouridine(55) synthase TruB [Eggerthellaceae bacterium]